MKAWMIYIKDSIRLLKSKFLKFIRYVPKNIEIPAILKPFIPDYIPAVRGPCEMILIPRPDD